MGLTAYILRRVLFLGPMLLGITAIAFVISHAVPADPVMATLGQRAIDDPSIVQAFRKQWGLDRPLYEQYVIYVAKLTHGDFGVSIGSRRAVATDLRQYLPATIELASVSVLLCVVVGIPLGIISATRRNTWFDHVSRFVSLIGVSLPVFWLGIVALALFYWKLGIAPGPGRLDPGVSPPTPLTGLYLLDSLLTGNGEAFFSAAEHIVLPSVVLASFTMGLITRLTRASMLEVLSQDYIRTARSKGLTVRAVQYKHALRNAMIPVVTVIGLAYGSLLSGAVLTETIFSWPGLGRYAFQSSALLDFPAIMGVSIVIAASYVFVNLAVDILYAFVDPKIRFG